MKVNGQWVPCVRNSVSYANSFKTLHALWAWCEDMHVVWILSTSHTSTDNTTGRLTDSKNSVFSSPLVSVSRPFLVRSSSCLYQWRI